MPASPELLDALRAALAPHEAVLEAYLFGSVARGDAQPHSDVDIAVYLDTTRTAPSPFGYDAELSADLGGALRSNRVDLVILNNARPLLYHRVLRDGVRILSRDLSATTLREGRALSRYCDYLPQLAKIESAHKARIARGDFGR